MFTKLIGWYINIMFDFKIINIHPGIHQLCQILLKQYIIAAIVVVWYPARSGSTAFA